jgi:hypothetical protein
MANPSRFFDSRSKSREGYHWASEMFEEMCQTRLSRLFVFRADLVNDGECHLGRIVVLMEDHREPVREAIVLDFEIWDLQFHSRAVRLL